MLIKKYPILFLVVSFLLNACDQKVLVTDDVPSQAIMIAVDGGYPPFSMAQPDGTVVGLDIDLALAICQEAELTCELKRPAWDNMIPMLENGEIDAIVASLSPTEQRKKRIDFTDTYVSTPVRFIGKESASTQLTTDFLSSSRIGVEGSTSLDGYLTENFSSATITRVHSVEELLALLEHEQVDYILTSALVGSYTFLKKSRGRAYSFIGPEIQSDKWFGGGAAIAINKNDEALKVKLNAAIARLHQNGIHKSIVDSYL